MPTETSGTSLKRTIVNYLVKHLVKDTKSYSQRFPTDMAGLRRVLKPGDVVLVEGSQRVSEVIKYLTQSSWSHAALYVGDTIFNHEDAEGKARLRERFGDDADALLVEATMETGVAAASIGKYCHHNVRICRAINLRPADLKIVLNSVTEEIGKDYDVDQVIDLLRYLFPVTLIPPRFRRTVLEVAGDYSKRVICSSQIARAFQKVRYPILPTIVAETAPARSRLLRLVSPSRWRKDLPSLFDTSVFRPCDPMLITPRDFDVSPYFEIIKTRQSEHDFDYTALKWVEPSTEPKEVATPISLATERARG